MLKQVCNEVNGVTDRSHTCYYFPTITLHLPPQTPLPGKWESGDGEKGLLPPTSRRNCGATSRGGQSRKGAGEEGEPTRPS